MPRVVEVPAFHSNRNPLRPTPPGLRLFFMNAPPSSVPFTQTNSLRRYARPIDESTKKNSFDGNPSTGASTFSQSQKHAQGMVAARFRRWPSYAENGLSKETRRSLRFAGIIAPNTQVVRITAQASAYLCSMTPKLNWRRGNLTLYLGGTELSRRRRRAPAQIGR